MAILFDETSVTVYPGTSRKKTVYLGEEMVARLSCFWDKRFPTGTTITSTWTVEENTNFTVATPTASGLGTQVFVTAPSDGQGSTATVRNKVVANNSETASMAFKIVCEET